MSLLIDIILILASGLLKFSESEVIIIDKPKFKFSAIVSSISTILGLIAFYFVPKGTIPILVTTIIVFLVAFFVSFRLYIIEVKKYYKQVDQTIIEHEENINNVKNKLEDLTTKHKALSQQFQNKSKKLEQANTYFNHMTIFLINSMTFTQPPYTKAQEHARYANLLQLITNYTENTEED